MPDVFHIPDHPVIRMMETTGYPDGKEPPEPRCPRCKTTLCEYIYRRASDGRVMGCDICFNSELACEAPECYPEDDDYDWRPDCYYDDPEDWM